MPWGLHGVGGTMIIGVCHRVQSSSHWIQRAGRDALVNVEYASHRQCMLSFHPCAGALVYVNMYMRLGCRASLQVWPVFGRQLVLEFSVGSRKESIIRRQVRLRDSL